MRDLKFLSMRIRSFGSRVSRPEESAHLVLKVSVVYVILNSPMVIWYFGLKGRSCKGSVVLHSNFSRASMEGKSGAGRARGVGSDFAVSC